LEFVHVDLFQAVILGIVQGLTEFLPISSTAHLRIVPALLGWPDPGAAFTAIIQIGTLVAVLAYFRDDILRIAKAWTLGILERRPLATLEARLGWMMILATLPIVVCGLLFEQQIEHQLRSLYVVAAAMIGLAVVLALAEALLKRRQREGIPQKQLEDVTWTDSVVTGMAQAVALVPGSSRSGTTITACLFLGLARDTAARFSFLLSLPAILAAGLYQFLKVRHELFSSSDDLLALAVSTVAAGIVGYWSIAFLLRYLKTHSTYLFIVYRLVVGGLILLGLWQGVLQP
jgi:undecaprenyl-diphosphatase